MATNYHGGKFVPPTKKQREKALGETNTLKDDIRRALTIAIDESFPPIPVPREDDWLNCQDESGQTVNEFEKSGKKRPSPSCNIIYIQPLGNFNTPRSPSLDIICEFSRIFFPGCVTEMLPEIDFDSHIKTRINQWTNQPQYYVPSIMSHLKRMRRKRHEHTELFAVGVTMMDIYPDPNWNFVYGEAWIGNGIGIYSFARFDPLFPDSSDKSCTNLEERLILKRAVGTYLHEVMHLFGLEHCIYYSCMMNGANHEEEMDRQPLYLCPICLKKMYLSFGKESYQIMKMYQDLAELTKRIGFEEEASWYENRLKLLTTN